MALEITNELIKTIKKNSYEKPDFIVEDIGTIDFKEKKWFSSNRPFLSKKFYTN